MADMSRPDLQGRDALVTGANHGIGAAIARTLADHGAGVVVTYLRLHDEPDPGVPTAYADARSQDAGDVLQAVRAGGGAIEALEADLADTATVPSLFEFAESTLGPVDILVNNATGWVADTFKPLTRDRVGRELRQVSHATIDQQFAIDARGGALLIAEFARRLVERGGHWGRIVSLTSGATLGFPEEASYGAAKAALVNYTTGVIPARWFRPAGSGLHTRYGTAMSRPALESTSGSER
jgi:3-oxoacyl-[acyl-carrier protein] reductase